MKRVRCVILLAALSLALPLVWATPAFAQRSLTVTPNTGLVELDTVTIEGAGFNPDVSVGFCQAIDDGSPSPNDCGSSVHGIFTSPAGDFSAQLTVRRFMYVPSLGRTVDCASEACAIGAAEVNDVTRTAAFASIAFAPAPPPPATRGSITVTPDDPVDGQQVTIDGTGFRANAKIEVLQCVTDPQDPTDCSSTFTTAVADAVGAFSAPYGVQRFFSPPGGPSIDCNPPGACVMAAAEVVDIPGTIATSPFDITAQQPDGRIRRRSDGVITGDNIYNDLSLQTRRHAVAPGGKWTFAVQLENDGDLADDITVTAPPSFAPSTVRYFVSYFDITSQVTGDGFTFTSVAPGQIWTIGVQFNAAADASLGSRAESLITFTSENAPSTDAVLVGVFVRAVTTQSGSD